MSHIAAHVLHVESLRNLDTNRLVYVSAISFQTNQIEKLKESHVYFRIYQTVRTSIVTKQRENLEYIYKEQTPADAESTAGDSNVVKQIFVTFLLI